MLGRRSARARSRTRHAVDAKTPDAKFRHEAALNFPGARAERSMQRVISHQLRNNGVAHFPTSRDVSTAVAERPGVSAAGQNPKRHGAGCGLSRVGRTRSKSNGHRSRAASGDVDLHRHFVLPVSVWLGPWLLRWALWFRFCRASSAWGRFPPLRLRSVLRSILLHLPTVSELSGANRFIPERACGRLSIPELTARLELTGSGCLQSALFGQFRRS